jgi:hypothetical protein
MAGAFLANLVLHAWSVAESDVPRYMSEWAARRQAMLWSAQLAMMAIAAALVAWIAWPLCTTPRSRAVVAMMGAVGASILLVALVPADGEEGFTLQEALHSAAAAPAFVTMVAAPGLAWTARHDVAWASHARLSFAAATLAFVTMVAMASSKVVGHDVAGTLERVPVLVIVAWFAIVAFALRRHIVNGEHTAAAAATGISAGLPAEPDS